MMIGPLHLMAGESGLLVYAYYRNKKFYVALGENEHKERETEAADVLETYTEIFKKHAL